MSGIDDYEPSRAVAREIRAECAREGLSTRALADRMGVPHTWLARRISVKANVDMTIEDLWLIAEALATSPAKLQADAEVNYPFPPRDPTQGPELADAGATQRYADATWTTLSTAA